jgi:hypothetical protein
MLSASLGISSEPYAVEMFRVNAEKTSDIRKINKNFPLLFLVYYVRYR